METIVVCAIVGLAATSTLVRVFGKSKRGSCGVGCGGCSCERKPPASLVNIRK
jgi:hypothetical protein